MVEYLEGFLHSLITPSSLKNTFFFFNSARCDKNEKGIKGLKRAQADTERSSLNLTR